MNKYRLMYILKHKREWVKGMIADKILYKRGYCWADLVGWYSGHTDWEDVGRVTKDQCMKCQYCGKFRDEMFRKRMG